VTIQVVTVFGGTGFLGRGIFESGNFAFVLHRGTRSEVKDYSASMILVCSRSRRTFATNNQSLLPLPVLTQ
jgi:hypothetical protein